MRTALIATAAGLSLLTAACSSSITSGTASGGRPTTAQGGSTATTAAAPAGGPSTTAAGGGAASTPAHNSGGGTDTSSWCGELEQAGNLPIENSTNGLTAAQVAKAEQIAADAPSEIRPDVEKLVSVDKDMLNGNPNADETEAVLKAGEHVVTWLQANCPGLMNKLNPGITSGLPTG